MMAGIDTDKIDAAALALLFLTMDESDRAWKGLDWSVTDRLHAKGLIDDPRNRKKSLELTPEGQVEAERLFRELFAKAN